MPLDLSTCLYLDFEARSEADIGEVGARAYAEHPTTELLCCGWVIGLQDEVHMWLPGEPFPLEWLLHAGAWVAQNKDTERFLLQYKLDIIVPSARWVDLATVASAAGMPRNLHDIGEALHLPVKKQSKTALLALARPRKLSKNNTSKWWTPEERPELYAQLYDYCKGDVDVMRKALAALPPFEQVMPPKEQRLAVLTDAMNDEGVALDVQSVRLAQEVVAAHGAQLRAEFAQLYPDVNPRHAPSVAKALGIDNARKETVRDALKDIFEEPRKRRALELLKTIKTASTAKLNAMVNHLCADGRLHGAMVFHGAGRTGRWSSMGVQLHNLMRGLAVSTPDWPAVDTSDGAMEKFFTTLQEGLVDIIYPDPTRAVAAAMRGFIWDDTDGLLSGDFSQIEARVLVAWARQENMVAAFRDKKDPYKIMAARIYSKDPEHVNKDERFMGKQSVLGAGYGVGKFGFQSMLKTIYDVDVSDEEAERIVMAYREANPRVRALWYAVERLAKQVLLTKPPHFICASDVPLIAMRIAKVAGGEWLVMRLPSGRCLWYYEPELVQDGGRSRIVYWGRDIKLGGRWARVETYGGKLVENATQAIARDVCADAMLRLSATGYRVALQVHDEVVAPGPAHKLDEYKSIMIQPPKWWPDLPVDVEAQHERRYQK